MNEIETQYHSMIDEVYRYIRKQYLYNLRPENCLITHGDINELNISSEGMFYDMAYVGLNSVYSEFVIGYVSIAFQNYFDMKYHRESYEKHERSIERTHTKYRIISKKSRKENIITVKIPDSRKEFLRMYVSMFRALIPDYYRVKMMIIFRLLTIRNVNLFTKIDIYYVFELCLLIYTTDSLDDMLKIVDY